MYDKIILNKNTNATLKGVVYTIFNNKYLNTVSQILNVH